MPGDDEDTPPLVCASTAPLTAWFWLPQDCPPGSYLLRYNASTTVCTPCPATVDTCTGSGAVAIALASELGGRPVIAVERSAAALRVAALNIARHANQRVLLVQGRWLEALARTWRSKNPSDRVF